MSPGCGYSTRSDRESLGADRLYGLAMSVDTLVTAIVTGAGGQDGYYLARQLLADGCRVHATIRSRLHATQLASLSGVAGLTIHELDITNVEGFEDLIGAVHPDEFYNFAGLSSVSGSFADPSGTWRTNADAVQGLLEAIRLQSPHTRFYQSSSTDMFGSLPGEEVIHNETAPFMPQSPYAAAKAAAHVLCDAYRRAYDLRISCGILANHESRRRSGPFLTRKVVDHVNVLRAGGPSAEKADPLMVGNLAAERDWGFAPDYVEGIVRVCRQVTVRAEVAQGAPEADSGSNYRDYVLGSGQLHAVWELVDRAFALGGHPLEWDRSSVDPADWSARFVDSGALAITVNPNLIRPSDPAAIGADPSRARDELGWKPKPGLDRFLQDMLADSNPDSLDA